MPSLGDLSPDQTHYWDGDFWQWQPLWFVPEEVIRAVRERFGRPATAAHYLGDGCLNQSWRLDTADGRYVLRVSRNDVTPEQVAYEHALTTALHEAIDAVVAPVPGADGATSQRWRGRTLSLFPFVEGVLGARVDSAVRAEAAAEMLARLHRVTVDDIRLGQRPGCHAVHEPPRWLWHHVKPALQRELGADQRFQELAAGLDREAAELDVWLNELEAADRLRPLAPVHGDFNPRNLIFRDDQIAGVIDFDGCKVDAIACEVAQVCVGADDPRAFFDCYLAAGGPLTPRDFELLGGFARIGNLSEVQWSLNDDGINRRVLDLLEEVLQGMDWLRQREQDLLA